MAIQGINKSEDELKDIAQGEPCEHMEDLLKIGQRYKLEEFDKLLFLVKKN